MAAHSITNASAYERSKRRRILQRSHRRVDALIIEHVLHVLLIHLLDVLQRRADRQVAQDGILLGLQADRGQPRGVLLSRIDRL